MESKKKSTSASNKGSNSVTAIYKSLIDHSSSAIFLSKPTGEIIEVNNAAEKMFGYSKTDFLRIGRKGILDYTDLNLTILLRQRSETGITKGELTGIKKNSEKFPIEFTSSIFKDHSGEELTCMIMQDITDRKIVEQEMLLMLNNTEECFILLNKELIILSFNNQFKQLYKKYFHFTVNKGLAILNFVKPKRLADVKQLYKNVLKGEIVYKELHAKDEEGTSHYFKIKYAPSKNTANEIIGIFITIRETTEETNSIIEIEKKQEKLEQAELNYRELFEKAIDGICIHELETGTLVDANQKACEIFGIIKENILNLALSVFAESYLGLTSENLAYKLNEAGKGIPQLFEGVIRQSNSILNWVEISLQKATIAGTEHILAYFRIITDRKNAEIQSQLQRQNKEALINSTEDLIWSVSNDFKLLAANNAFKAMIKMVTNKNLQEGDNILIKEFDEELIIKWTNYYTRALAGERYNVKEQFYNPLAKFTVYGLISFNPIFNNENKIVGVACYQKNITELTEKQMAIEATNAELDNVMESSLDMICTISDENIFERISAASKNILGYMPVELVGRNSFDFIYHGDVERSKNAVEKVIAGKIITNFYNRCVRKDGSLVYLEWTSKRDKKTGVRCAVARDVTAKVETENKLKLSEKRFKSLVQDGGDFIAIIDANANYTYISPTSFSILGYKPEELNLKNIFDFIHPEDTEMVKCYFSPVQSNKKINLLPHRFKHKNGLWRWIETSFTNLLDEPSIQGIVANSRDITERKDTEETLLITKENYRNLFENSPAPMFIFDFETLQIIDCNEETLLKYGYTKDEFLQLTIKDIRPVEDITKIENAVSNEESYGTIHKKNWRHKKKSGEIMYMDITGHLINYNSKRVSLVMLIDVTEKLRIEDLREFEKRDKEALINNTQDLIWSVSNGLKLIAVNKSYIKNMENLTGIVVKPGDDVLLEEYFPQAFTDLWKDYYLRGLKGKPFKAEIYNEAMYNRGERWIEVNFNPICNGTEITGVACNARDITDNIKAAEKLKQSEEKYRLLFYNSPLPKWIYDIKKLNIVEVNEKAVEHYGYTRDEFLQINIQQFCPVNDIKTFNEIITDAIKDDVFNLGLITHIKKNGVQIKVEISGHKIFYQQENCMLIVSHDVTEKEAALQILKDKEAKLENAQEVAKLGYWQLDLKTEALFWSKQVYKIWDLQEDFMPDLNFFISTIHPDDKSNLLEMQSVAILQEKDLDIEHRIILADGTLKWIHEKARVEKSLSGEVTFLSGTTQDITERKKAEEKIKHSNERYEHVTKATYDAIWEWDILNNLIYRAEGFERSFGFNLNELNKPETVWGNFIHAEDRQKTNDSLESTLKSDKNYWNQEYRLIKPNGEQSYVEDRAYILRNEAGEAQRVIGALRDITERKYYHDIETLEREVLERNARGEKTFEEVIEKYILGIQKLHPGMICSMQKLQNNRLYNLASPNLPEDYLAAIYGVEIGNNVGSCGTAAFLKEKIIVTDIATDFRWAKYKELAAKAGLRACWSNPIFDAKNNVVATFAIYYRKIKTPSAQEENTINRAGNILQTLLESHQRQAALLESNQRYLNVTKATFDAIWDWDISANNVYWGESYWQLFGEMEDEHLTDVEKVRARLHPEEKENILASAGAALEGKNLNWALEHRYLKNDFTYAYVLNKALIVRDANGNAVRVFGAMQDITQQKKEEQRLKLMSSVITSTNDAVLITEAELFNENGPRIIFANEAFTKMTGYTEAEIIGKTLRVLQGPKTDITELERLKKCLKKWQVCEVTLVNYKKNGDEFWNNFTVNPVADEKGGYTHFIYVEKDVTERKNEDLLKELLRKIRIIFNEPIGIKTTLEMVLKEVATFADFNVVESWLLSTDKKQIKRATYYVADSKIRNILSQSSKVNVQYKGEGIVGAAWESLSLQTWDAGMNMKNVLDEDALIVAGVNKLYALPFLNNAEIIGVLVFGLNSPETSTLKFENLFSSLKIYLGAEIKRKQLEQELNQIFNFAPDIIAILGTDGYFKKINPAACDLLEYCLDELMSVPFLTFVHPEDENKTTKEFKDLFANKAALYFENRCITKSGKVKWFAWTSILSKEDEVLFTVGKNITEKKDLEVVLNKTNNLARIGSWELDVQKSTLYWSEMTMQIHETPKDFQPTLHKARQSYKKGKNREIMSLRIAAAIESGIGWDEELVIITETGKEKWIRSIGKAEFNNGICLKVYGSLQDINERKRAQENIRSSEERRELIMKAALDGIICIDKNGIVTFWNPQAESIFGWKESEVMGRLLSSVIIPDQYKDRHEKGMENYFKTGKGHALNKLLQLSAIKKSGEEFPIELTVLPIEQDGDEFFCAFIRDITERKLSETRLLNLNQSLQTQTYQLAAINKELEQFAYVASHDLQEPLRMITSFLSQIELKYENVLDEKGKKYIYFAVDGAKRMRQIILDLLEYSTTGRINDLKENIDLNTIVDEIKLLYKSKIEEQEATIIFNELPLILSYKSPVRQVFQNIIGNSLKYCKKNRPCLIKIFAVDMVTHWQFSIQDNGIGISKEYFDKIFVIFQRLHTKEIYSGTGLGLAVTKKIIENLNGKIWLESVENEGTIFYFTIPKI